MALLENCGLKIYTKDIILILAASFFYFSSPMLVTPLITGFSGSLGASAAVMGIIGGLTNMCSLLCRPFAGNFADMFSKYKVAMIGGIMILLSCIGYIVAVNEVFVVIARIINGVGFACCSVCMSTWMSNMLPENRIGSGMGLYGTMNALAMAISPALGILVYHHMGYRAAFVLAGIFALINIIIIQFVKDRGQPQRKITQTGDDVKNNIKRSGSEGTNVKRNIVDVKVIPIAIIIMLFAIPYCATQSFLVNYAQVKHLGISVSLFFPVYAMVLMILRLTLKKWFDRWSFRIFLVGGLLCAFLSIMFLAVMDNNAEMLMAAAFMAGGYGIMCSVCQSNAILVAGKSRRGLANSTYYMGLDLGMTLGPMIGGILMGNIDIKWFYPDFLLTIPLCFVTYLIMRAKRVKHR